MKAIARIILTVLTVLLITVTTKMTDTIQGDYFITIFVLVLVCIFLNLFLLTKIK